ncbi:ATP-binding cassette multidrug transporter PDR12 [Sugiyamaella lignohabitans]|uniref:ATP-binding cassette multidrug transporter PDR12 n=1 Tax=Sugiyamaella lignohabitans TaxID=796027 RepID=A0A167F475_9ASCO|nr:ATP-binding cassette multidrug transporter PDR12 [Sugiyamaella lignohabitans]ANB14811.1 ATP-binding cassette multidrug transporter PDR12 [Sugiyamaella lignohabitans]
MSEDAREDPSPLGEGYDVEAYNPDEALVHSMSRVMSTPEGTSHLEALTRVLSTRTLKDGKLEINPEDFNLRALLKTLVRRMDNEGLDLNTTGVAFRNLTTIGVDAGASYAPTVYELIRSIVALPLALKKLRSPPLRNLIQDIDGLIIPGEMLLVLGRPGSGCTTLLRTIAGEIDQFKGIQGNINYDGVSQSDMLKYFKSQVLYNPECKLLVHSGC